MRSLLNQVIDEKYASSSESQESIRGVEREELKKEAVSSVKDLCSSVINKIELLNYKLLAIKSFDWDKLHNFKYHQNPTIHNNRVAQELRDGTFVILCSDKEIMEQFIFTEITSFFSNVSGIIDNVALLIRYSFRLDIKNNMILLNDVYERLSDGSLKDFLKNYTKDKYNFWGMRDIRTACEHKVLTSVFLYSEKAGLGTKDLGVPYINNDIRKPDLPEENRVDIYCGFLYEKICDFLKGLMVALSNTK